LIATPVAYSLLDDLRHTARWRRLAPALSGIGGRLRKPRRSPGKPAGDTAETLGDEKREQVGAGVSGD
jgi:hypothetical protein